MNSSLAAIFHEPSQPLELRNVAVPAPIGGEVLVRVLGCTLCGSDLHTVSGRRNSPAPSVLGHEIVGEIVELGASAPRHDLAGAELGVGDRVTWAIVASCGDCFYCQRELPQKCLHGVKYGHEQFVARRELTGGLAEYCLLAPGTALVKLPEELPLEVVCPANCATATVAAALAAAGPIAGRTVGILGAGMLGLTACAMAQLRGAAVVIAVEPNTERREQALRCGATHAIAPDELVATAAAASAGPGLDVVLELSGAAAAFETAWPVLCIGGTLVLVGAVFPGPPVAISLEQIVRRNLTLRGVHNYAPKDLLVAVEFLKQAHGRFPLQELVGPWYPLKEVAQAFAAARNPRHLRVGVRN
ncbi:MAG: zinc-binding dehydrogenase [Pirellulales bacterium]|nr:zinc-binding dehydrogenase [Pirellulales bacterium]